MIDREIRQLICIVVPIITSMQAAKNIKDLLVDNCFESFSDGIRAGVIQFMTIILSICVGIIVLVILKKCLQLHKIEKQ
jgi:uncharacterized membrane protein